MLVLPGDLALSETFTFVGTGWGICDLCDQVCSRCLCNAVHQHSDVRCLEDHSEGERETEQNTLTVLKPAAFLFWCEVDPAKVGLKLYAMSDMKRG